MYGIFNVPTAVNEPIISYAPAHHSAKHLSKPLKPCAVSKLMYQCILAARKCAPIIKRNFRHLMITSMYSGISHRVMPLMLKWPLMQHLLHVPLGKSCMGTTRCHIFARCRIACNKIPLSNQCCNNAWSVEKCFSG